MNIITNNQPRPIIYGCELPEKVKRDFDYYDQNELDNATFFKYRGQYYDLGDFLRCGQECFANWHGYRSDSFFSGLLVRLSSCGDFVTVGSYYA